MAIIDEKGVRRRLEIMLGDKALAAEYIRRHGYRIDFTKIQALRATPESLLQEGGMQPGDPRDPVFGVFVRCPSCYLTGIPHWELRAKSQMVILDRFQMPTYQGTPMYHTVDYNLVAVTVCPQCLFASPDKRDFIGRDPARAREIPPRLHQGELAAILASADERSDWLATQKIDANKELFTRSRTPLGGLCAYQLAHMRAQIEYSRRVPFSAFKMGGYALKQAGIARCHNVDETPYFKAALSAYMQSFTNSNAPGLGYEGQTLYEIVAICVRLGELERAAEFLGALEALLARIRVHGRHDESDLRSFERWHTLTRDLWSLREDPDLWTSPSR